MDRINHVNGSIARLRNAGDETFIIQADKHKGKGLYSSGRIGYPIIILFLVKWRQFENSALFDFALFMKKFKRSISILVNRTESIFHNCSRGS